MSFILCYVFLLLGLSLPPASCLPQPYPQSDTRSAHISRATPSQVPGWEIAVVIVALMVGLVSIGLIGGACESLLCMQSKRPATQEADDLDFGCKGSTREVSEMKTMDTEGAGGQASFQHEERGLDKSGPGRYSWRDGQGVMTEVYLDGVLPDAGPPPRAQHGLVTSQVHAYPVQAAMRGHGRSPHQSLAAGLASNPPFVVHDDSDDSDYKSDRRWLSHALDHPARPEVAVLTDGIVSPLTPEDHSIAWPQRARSRGQTTDMSSNILA